MQELLTFGSLISLLSLTFLEVVLGIDNVIFVSILMGRLPEHQRNKARRIWMFGGITTRVTLLALLGWIIANGNTTLFSLMGYGFNLRNIIMLLGGLFLLYKTVVELHAKMEGLDPEIHVKAGSSFSSIIGQIILIDMIFSFDSIVTAQGLASKLPVMIIAVVIAMVIMFLFSERIANFIHKYPTLKVLALAFLLMVGFSLFFEGLEPLHGSHINKGYIYFAMAFSFGVELMNLRVRRKQLAGKV
jgi:predicted tellurium resistance membrane protein TerC